VTAYYNENDKYAAQWLRNLIADGLIPRGEVDDRSICDVQAGDLAGYTQCHFFAGLGGWSRALRLAGWPDDRPVWTGSPPCQPFSVAGKSQGTADSRHLWPSLSALIRECRPPIFFGEQVARAIGMGWFDAVAADLEKENYAVASAVLPACSVGAPHRRDRLWFVGYSTSARQHQGEPGESGSLRDKAWGEEPERRGATPDARGEGLSVTESETLLREGWGEEGGAIAQCDWWATEPDVGRVANGVPARVGKLRALGNAIVPQVAEVFIRSVM
jgi:DNA (cytosine-5)-methyltransferase 1